MVPASSKDSREFLAGEGLRRRLTPAGWIFSAIGNRFVPSYPFKVTLTGSGASIFPGTVNLLPATIDGVPLDDDPAPELVWRRLALDSAGRGYIAVECTFHTDNWAVAAAEIIQVATLEDKPVAGSGGPGILGGTPILSGRRARHPLAMIRQRSTGSLSLFPIVQSALQLRVDVRTMSDGYSAERGRAFFSPA